MGERAAVTALVAVCGFAQVTGHQGRVETEGFQPASIAAEQGEFRALGGQLPTDGSSEPTGGTDDEN